MTTHTDPITLHALCASLAADARSSHQIPDALARDAVRITARALGSLDDGPLSPRDRARVRAYFWSIVRRRALRTRGASGFASKLVRQSIAEDLRRAGLAEERIASELERCSV